MRRALPTLFCLAALAAACAKDPGQATTGQHQEATGGACFTDADCPPEMWCLNQRCSDRAMDPAAPGDPEPANLSVTPASLNFGIVAPTATRTLAVVLENAGNRMITLTAVRVSPAGSPFRVEPMGYGPFWIRPGRTRELFITFAPRTSPHVEATLDLESESPTRTLTLLGN